MVVRCVEKSSLLLKVIPSTFSSLLFLIVTLFDTSCVWCRGWLGQYGLSNNASTRSSFANSRLSIWFSVKPSKARRSVLIVWLHVLKQMLGQFSWSTETLRIFENLSVKSSLHTSNKCLEHVTELYISVFSFKILNFKFFSACFSFSNIGY